MFKKAVKHESKLRLAIYGPSGSGKTYTSLRIAASLGGPVAVIDTERGSASKYADQFEFDVLNMDAPYHPDNFIRAIQAAEQAGYQVLIVDSLSHVWNGPGGILEIVDEEARKLKGNSYVAWAKGTPLHNRLIDAMTRARLHIIGTMRSKTEYVLETNERGKTTPRKVGTAPVQRDGMEYEFDVALDMTPDNDAIVQKTRCPALTGRVFNKPGEDVADILKEWLHGEPVPIPTPPTNGDTPVRRRDDDARARGLASVNALMQEVFASRDAFYSWAEEAGLPIPHDKQKGRLSLAGCDAPQLRQVYAAMKDLQRERAAGGAA